MEPILSVEHLSVTFTRYGRGLNRVELNPIRDLSLAVEPGRVTAVVGESGSGKSLLAHAVLHLLPRNARVGGTLRYDGAPLTQERAAALRGREIALIPQGVTWLDPMMKVGDQLRRGRGGGEVRDRCRAALERYGLGPEVEELYPFQLSGGPGGCWATSGSWRRRGPGCCSSPTTWGWPGPWPIRLWSFGRGRRWTRSPPAAFRPERD